MENTQLTANHCIIILNLHFYNRESEKVLIYRGNSASASHSTTFKKNIKLYMYVIVCETLHKFSSMKSGTHKTCFLRTNSKGYHDRDAEFIEKTNTKKNSSYLKFYYPFGTNLDDFCGTVSHGKRTGIETRGGREDEQLAHLVHTTGKQISKDLSFSCLTMNYSLKNEESDCKKRTSF